MPFNTPGCYLMNNVNQIKSNVTTKYYGAQHYAVSYDLIQLRLNDGFVEAHTNQPTSYATAGAEVALNEAMKEAVRGFMDLSNLDKVIPAAAQVVGLPTCGVILRQASVPGERTFAMFWTATADEFITSELAVGDSLDLENEQVFF